MRAHPRRRLAVRSAVLAACALLAPRAAPQSQGAASPAAVQQAPAKPPLSKLPALPQLAPGSPRSTLLYADRIEVRPALKDLPAAKPASAPAPVLVNKTIPAATTGTGMSEIIQYQLPTSYLPKGPAVPLLVAWHGFGSSAGSVALQTTLDEHCEARGWAYLSVTGIDDKLFGPPVSQQNVEAAIGWMQQQFRIDGERIVMVGFSMGGGVAANFAARHRDPDGLMIAAIASVSGSFDWTMTWVLDAAVQVWMNNPWNFGGPPGLGMFPYQRSSALFHDPLTYPPPLGQHLDLAAMARNLHATPAYLTWDTGDTIPYLPAQSSRLATLLAAQGGIVQTRVVSGTLNPTTGLPATHSWAVLDEAELFDFLAQHTAQRLPAAFDAQLDGDAAVSWAVVRQRAPGSFSWLGGRADAAAASLELLAVENAEEVAVRLDRAGLAGAPSLALAASAADSAGFRLRLTGAPAAGPGDGAIGALLDPQSGLPMDGFDIEPSTGSLLVDVPGHATLHAVALAQPWDAALTLLPDPAPPGAALVLELDAAPGTPLAWLVVATAPAVTPLPSGKRLFVSMAPPMLLLPLALDAAGDVRLDVALPDEPALSGTRLWLQALLVTPGAGVSGLSNVFPFDVL